MEVTNGLREKADDMYKGRLCLRSLKQILGHNQFYTVKTLDLSGQHLRFIQAAVHPKHFPDLEVLQLANNSIAEV